MAGLFLACERCSDARGRLNAVVVAEAKFIGRYRELSINRRRLLVYGRSIDPLCDKAPVTKQSSIKYGMEGTRKLPFPLDAATVLCRSQEISPLIRIKYTLTQSDINVRKREANIFTADKYIPRVYRLRAYYIYLYVPNSVIIHFSIVPVLE